MPEYKKRKLDKGMRMAKMNEAFLAGTGKIDGQNLAIGVLDSYSYVLKNYYRFSYITLSKYIRNFFTCLSWSFLIS